MTPIRFIYKNLWRNGTILTQSSEQAQFPAENTQDDCKTLAWRSKYGAGSNWGLFRITAANQNIFWGEEVIVNGGMESWASATDLNSWTEDIYGTSTVNRESTTIKYGTYSCRLDIDASNSAASISQSISLVANSAHLMALWYKTAVGKMAYVRVVDSGNHVYLKSDGTWAAVATNISLPSTDGAWVRYNLFFTSHASYTSYNVLISRETSASSSIYIDNFSICKYFFVQITVGDYDATTISAEIKSKMQNSGSTYTVSYSDTTNKFSISVTPGYFKLALSQQTNAVWETIGFTGLLDTEIFTSATAGPIRIHSIETVDCDLGSAYEYDFVAVLGHNFTAGATVQIIGADDSAFSINVITDVLTYNGNNIFEFLQFGTPSDAEYVVILGGVNDIAQGHAAADIESNLQAMYDLAHAAGIKVVAVNISPFGGCAWAGAPELAIQSDVNSWIANSARNVDYVVDIYTVLLDPSVADALLPAYDDGGHLHLTSAGYAALGLAVYNAVPWVSVNNTKVYLMGDSLTGTTGHYGTQLAASLGASWTVVWKGISGQVTIDMLLRFIADIGATNQTVRVKRYVRFAAADPANPSLYVSVGVIVIGKYFQPNRGIAKGYSENDVDETEMEKAPSQNLFMVQKREILTNWSIPFRGLDAASGATVKLMRRNNGVEKALVFCTDSTAPNTNSNWAHFLEPSPTEFEALTYGNWSAELEEVL